MPPRLSTETPECLHELMGRRQNINPWHGSLTPPKADSRVAWYESFRPLQQELHRPSQRPLHKGVGSPPERGVAYPPRTSCLANCPTLPPHPTCGMRRFKNASRFLLILGPDWMFSRLPILSCSICRMSIPYGRTSIHTRGILKHEIPGLKECRIGPRTPGVVRVR